MKRLLLMLLPLFLCGAASFNGTTEGASTAGTLSFGTNILTVSYLVRFTGTTGVRVMFESSSDYNASAGRFAAFYNSPSTRRETWSTKGSGASYRLEHTQSDAATNQWLHRVVVYNASISANDIIAYGDGLLLTLTTVNANAGSTANFTDQRLYVGARNQASFRFSGEFQDFAIYAGEVSAAEAYALGAQRMSPRKVRSAKLLYHWPFSAGETPNNSPDLVGGIPVNSGTKSITTEQAPTFRK